MSEAKEAPFLKDLMYLLEMATSVLVTCDFPVKRKPCGVEATTKFGLVFAGIRYEGDVCAQHVEAIKQQLADMGMKPAEARIDGKTRGAWVAASGRAFTTGEARRWLVERGYDVHPQRGRISNDLIQLYAEAH